jgi:hypothetical protein
MQEVQNEKTPCTSRDPLSSMITNALEDRLPSMINNTALKDRLSTKKDPHSSMITNALG